MFATETANSEVGNYNAFPHLDMSSMSGYAEEDNYIRGPDLVGQSDALFNYIRAASSTKILFRHHLHRLLGHTTAQTKAGEGTAWKKNKAPTRTTGSTCTVRTLGSTRNGHESCGNS